VINTYPVPPPPAARRGRVSFDRVLSKSYWMWRTNPALMVPTMLSTSITVLTQSVFLIFGTLLLIELESNGSFSLISSDLASGNLSALGGILISHQVVYPTVEYLGAALAVSTIVSLLANGYASSSEYLSYLRAIGDERVGITSVFSTLKLKWKPMAWTFFLVQLLTYLPVGLLSLLGVWLIYSGGPTIFSVLELEGLFFLGLILTALVAFTLMYSMIAVAVENVSGFSAIKWSYHMITGNFVISFIYAIVTVVSYLGISLVSDLATSIGVPLTALASIAITLLLIPVLHLTKTLVYVQVRTPTKQDELLGIYGPISGSRDLFWGPFFRFALNRLKQGVFRVKSYALNWRNTPYHFASTLAFVLGIILGEEVGTHGLDQAIFALGYQPGRINPTILQNVPFTTGLDIFLHNWEVSLSTALAGMWLVAPSLLTLAFNGMILGVVYYLTPNFTMFAAAIFPHGSIELPSFVIAGSAGMRLGVAFIRSLGKGSDSPQEHEFEIIARETIYVVIGLAVLFFIAGLIEGNITPVIMRMYGWK
jgi:uncharacterized membrane protein SpoIIM required for sporulation